jgi:hypothetical protein
MILRSVIIMGVPLVSDGLNIGALLCIGQGCQNTLS